MTTESKSETVKIAEEIADAVVAVLEKLNPVALDAQHVILSVAEGIAREAYGYAHPCFSNFTAAGTQILQQDKEN